MTDKQLAVLMDRIASRVEASISIIETIAARGDYSSLWIENQHNPQCRLTMDLWLVVDELRSDVDMLQGSTD